MSQLENLLNFGPPLIAAVVLHEVAHGWIAEKLGDPTARSLGRITLNPLRHIDPVMTLLLPGLLILSGSPIVFGGAKPVPVNPAYFKNPRRGMALVAVAGPITNFLLASVCYVLFQTFARTPLDSIPLPHSVSVLLGTWLLHSILINLVLGLFNLIPVPPLDGGRIAVGFLPLPIARRYARIERWGLPIVFLILYSGIFTQVLGPLVEAVLSRILGQG